MFNDLVDIGFACRIFLHCTITDSLSFNICVDRIDFDRPTTRSQHRNLPALRLKTRSPLLTPHLPIF